MAVAFIPGLASPASLAAARGEFADPWDFVVAQLEGIRSGARAAGYDPPPHGIVK